MPHFVSFGCCLEGQEERDRNVFVMTGRKIPALLCGGYGQVVFHLCSEETGSKLLTQLSLCSGKTAACTSLIGGDCNSPAQPVHGAPLCVQTRFSMLCFECLSRPGLDNHRTRARGCFLLMRSLRVSASTFSTLLRSYNGGRAGTAISTSCCHAALGGILPWNLLCRLKLGMRGSSFLFEVEAKGRAEPWRCGERAQE